MRSIETVFLLAKGAADMKITVSDRASKWFHEDMGLDDGRGVRLYGKVYGKTPVHDGFSLALTPDDNPDRVYAETEKDGVTYWISEGDKWFFVGYDLGIDYDSALDGPKYDWIKNEEL